LSGFQVDLEAHLVLLVRRVLRNSIPRRPRIAHTPKETLARNSPAMPAFLIAISFAINDLWFQKYLRKFRVWPLMKERTRLEWGEPQFPDLHIYRDE